MVKMKRNQTWQGTGAFRAEYDLRVRVKRAVAASLTQGNPTIVQTAKAAGMSARSLQRRLSDLGVTYSQIRDEVRLEAACILLQRTETSLAQISSDLGYADPANFTRAFHRWTGQNPSAYRRRVRQVRCGRE